MANADLNSKEFVVIGELTENCEFIQIHHHKPLARVIKHMLGKKLEVGFKIFKYKRSDAQNRWLFGVAYITICAWWKETFGEKVSKELIHAYSKQVVLGAQDNISIAFSKQEFLEVMDDFYELANTKSKEDLQKLILKVLPNWEVNVRVEELLGRRVVLESKEVSTASMNTQEFCDFKDILQAHWSEKGCDIPDPRENNLLSDYIDE